MTSQHYQQLNPLALAVAAGCTAVIAPVLIGLPMMGFGGMMGGMWGYHGGYSFGWGFGLLSWAVGVLLAALIGATFAWIYNAVNHASASSSDDAHAGPTSTNVPAPQ